MKIWIFVKVASSFYHFPQNKILLLYDYICSCCTTIHPHVVRLERSSRTTIKSYVVRHEDIIKSNLKRGEYNNLILSLLVLYFIFSIFTHK